ncbi:MAG: FHA domain-containing protein [Myxococcota bacterium]|nr:FHA domain-containing protein [Myxococcota bacterium]
MIRLTALINLEDGRRQALTYESSAQAMLIGRDDTCDFQLGVASCSRQHARITEIEGVYFLEDLHSTHGVLLNGNQITAGEKTRVKDGDVIEITKAKLTCSIESEQILSTELGDSTQVIATKAVQGILGRLSESQEEGGAYFRVLSGAQEGGKYVLAANRSEWVVGRAVEADWVLDDPNISRSHVRVRKEWSGFFVEDMGSRNGVRVGPKTVEGTQRLRDRDEVSLGPVKLLFIDPNAALMESLKDVPGFDFGDESQENPSLDISDDGSEEELVAIENGDDEFSESILGDDLSVSEGFDEFVGGLPDKEIREEMNRDADVSDKEVPDYKNIDPALLEKDQSEGKTEWVMIAAAIGIIVVASGVLFFVVT